MRKKNKNFALLLFVLIIFIVGCRPPTSSGGSTVSGYSEGTDGLVMNFLAGTPPSKMYMDESGLEIPITVEVRNKGSHPQSDDTSWSNGGVIFISGYDQSMISTWKLEDEDMEPSINLNELGDVLEGKSVNNPEGGYDLLEFTANLDFGSLNSEIYNPTFLVTACYDYKTVAGPNVCIDPTPFSTAQKKKVCSIGDISLKNQGAPIAITKVESTALSNSIQFKIHFKNVGKGDVIAIDLLDRCSGTENLERRHMDVVRVDKVQIGNENLECGQLLDVEKHQDYARLIDGEGFIVCNLKNYKTEIGSEYTTPLNIELVYGYRNSISQSMEIIKVP